MGDKLLAALLPVSIMDRDAVNTARIRLLRCIAKNIDFTKPTEKLLYQIIVKYFKATKSFFDADMLKDILVDNGIEADLMANTLVLYSQLVTEQVPDDKFEFYFTRYLETREKKQLEDTLLQALDELKTQNQVDGEPVVAKVKNDLVPVLFSSEIIKDDIPQGDILEEFDDVMSEYELLEQGKGNDPNGIYTGIQKIDDICGPMVPSDLIVLAGASGEGKSYFSVNLAWHAAVMQHKNVIVFTAETARTKYRRRFVIRHSCMTKFGGPISAKAYKQGHLSYDEKETLKAVLVDWKNGKEDGTYGRINLVQIGAKTDLNEISTFCEKEALTYKVDMVIIDYLSLLQPSKRRGSAREEIAEMFKNAKQLATTFNKGQGMVLVVLHQISYQAREKARFEPGKCYTIRDLADTSEATKSADTVISIFRDEDMINQSELGTQILKSRDADSNPDECMFRLLGAYDNSLIANLEE